MSPPSGGKIGKSLEEVSIAELRLLAALAGARCVKGYTERSNDGSTSATLAYRKQHRRSTLLSAG